LGNRLENCHLRGIGEASNISPAEHKDSAPDPLQENSDYFDLDIYQWQSVLPWKFSQAEPCFSSVSSVQILKKV